MTEYNEQFTSVGTTAIISQGTTSIQEIRHKANELRTLIEKFMSEKNIYDKYTKRALDFLLDEIDFLEQWKD